MSVPVVVCGRGGRMATLIAEAVRAEPGLELLAQAPTRPHGVRLADVATRTAARDPVVVDFTAREATAALLRQALSVPCALVVGTSGLDAADRELLDEVATKRPIVVAANFSVALSTVARFVRDLAGQVGPEWSAGLLDVHFAGKRDRPSATALFLAQQWARSAGADPEVTSFRMGDGVSEHRLLAAGPGEQIEVLHRVADRRAFLPGVLRSIRFVAQAPPGIYALDDTATTGERTW